MMIRERCPCGAEFEYDDATSSNMSTMPMQLQAMLNDFRSMHKCKGVVAPTSPAGSPF